MKKRNAFSLLELLAVVVILGIIAAIVLPRITQSSDVAKANVNSHNKATLNAAIERYYANEGSWPATLAAMVPDYVPDGIPINPVTNAAYGYDTVAHRVTDS